MTISNKDVEHVANLARLNISDDERERFSSQLTQIFGHIEKLNALNTEDVKPTSQFVPVHNIVRKDVVGNIFSSEHLRDNAPEVEENHYKVPKIIE